MKVKKAMFNCAVVTLLIFVVAFCAVVLSNGIKTTHAEYTGSGSAS